MCVRVRALREKEGEIRDAGAKLVEPRLAA